MGIRSKRTSTQPMLRLTDAQPKAPSIGTPDAAAPHQAEHAVHDAQRRLENIKRLVERFHLDDTGPNGPRCA